MHHHQFADWYVRNEETILGVLLLVLAVLLLLAFIAFAPERLPPTPTHGLSGEALYEYLRP